MHFVPQIKYASGGGNIDNGDGTFTNPLVGGNIPVTKISATWILEVIPVVKSQGARATVVNHECFGMHFMGEYTILKEVFDGLVRNCLDANSLEISFCWDSTPEKLELYIADDGEGVNSEMKKTLFEYGMTNKAYGLGCFLAQVKGGYLPKIGADISYVGTGIGGKGATFKLTFLREMPA